MLKRFIIFLIRKRLGLKRGEQFQFENQRDVSEWYYFADDGIKKHGPHKFLSVYSGVSLNWLLNDKCKIIKKEV